MTTVERSHVLDVALSSNPHLVSYISSELVYQYANPTYAQWFDLGLNQVVGHTVTEVLGAQAAKELQPYFARVLNGEIVEFERVIPYKHGTPRRIHVIYYPDKSITGEVLGFTAIVRDVTHEREQEALIHESEKRLQYALEATGEGVWDWHIREGTVHHNLQWCTILGLNDRYLIHPIEFFANLLHPDDRADVMARVQACVEKKQPYQSEHRMLREDGKYIWVLDRGKVVEWDSDGKATRMVGSYKDITEKHETQARLIQASKMATLGEMAGGIAHEINNPLAIILGKAEQLQRRVEEQNISPEQITQGLSQILQTAERISKIIKGLKSFSRYSAEDPFIAVPLSQIVHDTLELCHERFKHHGIELNVQGDIETHIQCRPAQVSQVLMNLLNNAHDAVEGLPEKWVKLHIKRAENKVAIRVTDSGNGIPSLIAQKIYHPFFTTKEVGKGTGLGLSISQGIAEEHHGQLTYDSSSPHTCFVFTLPVHEQDKHG